MTTTATEAPTSALAEYSPTAAALADLRQRFFGVVWDVTTTKGNNEARAARLELVKLRTSLEAKRKELKAPALERSRLIDAEAARITGEIVALERPIDEQIKADEARREAEREAKRQAEALRLRLIMDKINSIRSLAVLPAGTKAADIAAGIAHAEGLELFEADFDEMLPAAERARGEVLGKLQALHVAAVDHEAAQARLEEARAELAKARAEQEAMARQLAADRAAVEAAAKAEQDRAEAAAAEQRRAAQALADERAAFDRQQAAAAAAEAQRVKDAQDAEDARLRAVDLAAKALVAPEPIPMQIVAPHTVHQAPDPFGDPDEPATLKLGDIAARLGFTLQAAFIADTLGIVHTATDKSAKLYKPSDFGRICAALVKHVQGVAK